MDATTRRHPGTGGHDVLRVVDLTWSRLSPAGRGLAERTSAGADAYGGLNNEVVKTALAESPTTTRAWSRGRLVNDLPGQVVAASWHPIVLETGERVQRHLPPTGTLTFIHTAMVPAFKDATSAVEVLSRLTGECFGGPG